MNVAALRGVLNKLLGGVCITHGAIKIRYKCSFEGCTKHSRKGGVCFKHGAPQSNDYSNNITFNNNNNINNTHTSHNTETSESTQTLFMPPCDDVVTTKECDDVKDDSMDIITITTIKGRIVNIRILSL